MSRKVLGGPITPVTPFTITSDGVVSETIPEPTARFPYETAVTTAGTPAGNATAFAQVPNFLVVWSDLAVWVAETSAATLVAGDGSEGGRIFVPAGAQRVLPWRSRAFFAVNSEAGEEPVVNAEGWK